MDKKRRRFQGVLNILSFNRHYYLYGLLALAVLIIGLRLIHSPHVIYWLIVPAFLYGLLMPLFVSAYVYDYSGFYEFDWLKNEVHPAEDIRKIVNINAGFDETSFIIQRKFPEAELQVFDFYNARQHTEPAIKRARRVTQEYPNTAVISTASIPLYDGSADIVFLLSAAHEIRSHQEKIAFLKECRRLCKPHGKIIMVEHLRDLPNFLAFTIGFTHFFSRFTWKHAFQQAGFSSLKETKFTPFMSIFNCQP